jgi:hypothetical protein
MTDQPIPYEAPSVEEVSDGDCPVSTASMISADG